MKVEIKIPSMGESISEATIANIIKPSGSQVAMDDEILELETDKVNQVIYAPQAGVITITVKPNEKVKIGQVIGSVDTEATSASPKKEAEASSDEPKQKAQSDLPKSEPENADTPASPKKEKVTPAPTLQPETEAPKVAPTTTKTARYNKEDFIQDLQQPKEAVSQTPAPISKPSNLNETHEKMSNIRKVIATRLVEVKNTTAMLTTFNEVDMSHVMGLREKYKEAFMQKYGVKLGFMSFFVKASIAALQQFPAINSYINGDDIVHREYFNIGIAVGTDRGLFVPVLRDCDKMSYADIEMAIENYAKKAREGKISVDDLQGGGFTITNGGVYGSMLSTPIMNPNQSAILGLHKITKRPVVIDDQVVIRPIMYVALSYDHRIVDGKEAVSFLVQIKNHIEFPDVSLLGL